MINTNGLIEIYSDMNPWMDFIISVKDTDFEKAKTVSEEAFDSYWDDSEAECVTLSEWVGMKMYDNGIECEMYFKDDEEGD